MPSTTTQMASLAVLVSLVCAAAALFSAAAAVRVDLTRIHATDPSVTASQFVRDALRRDMHRQHARARQLADASSDNGTVTAPVQESITGAEYLMTVSLGTPAVSIQAIADTGSDLIWTQCAPCGSQCYPQPVAMYDPSNSTTYATLPCNSSLSLCSSTDCGCMFNATYGSGWSSVYQGTETFTFGGSTAVSDIVFGCSNASGGFDYGSSGSGIVGLGRGGLSLVSQLGDSKFSYCLAPLQNLNTSSTLLIGPSASLSNDTGVGSTPFITSPSSQPMSTYYYLNLTGISLGTTELSIPSSTLSLNSDGTGGLIIDSGTTITLLANTAYQQVRDAVVSQLTTLTTVDASASTGLDLCFDLSNSTSLPSAPNMTLHFDGADMVLSSDNYMMVDSNLWCLAMRNQTDGQVSIFGNYQQQNMHILYDLGQETLSFASADCSTL